MKITKTKKKLFKKSYKKSSTKNLKEMLDLINSIEDFLNKDKYELIINCIKKESDIDTITQEITKLRIEVEGIIRKFAKIIRFNHIEIKRDQIAKIGEILNESKISLSGIDYFSSEKSKAIFNSINSKIEELESIVDELVKDIGSFVGFVLSSINSAKCDINFFLQTAGINYELEILQNEQNDIRTILRYITTDKESVEVEKIRDHLSWGEKNAFSLVLFMHYALSRNADLIILDDPISSFDDNKKYAIINRLFRKHSDGKSFLNRTVLMFSHDFEPIIDFILNNKPTGGHINAEYLRNLNGLIESSSIKKENVFSWITLLKRYAKDDNICIINRLAFLRKYIELLNDSNEFNIAYQIISSLQHGYPSPKEKIGEELNDIDSDNVEKGLNIITQYIPDFKYTELLSSISNESNIKKWYREQTNNYFKLQVFRCFLEITQKRDQIKDDNLLKYIDETYHIENDYIYFLDLEKYEIVPEHIIEGCNSFIL